MKILLLAAGRGTRLGAKTAELPKTLIPLAGKPFCHHILDNLRPFNPELAVVGGFEYDQLVAALKGYLPRIEFIRNPDYFEGNLLTLLAGKPLVGGPFLMSNADHLFSKTILREVFAHASSADRITVIADSDRPLTDDDMKILKKSPDTVERMDKKLKTYQAGYIGMTYVPEGKLELYWQTAERVLAQSGRGACVEEVVNRLAAQGEPIGILDVSGSAWVELDTAEDLARANDLLARVTGE